MNISNDFKEKIDLTLKEIKEFYLLSIKEERIINIGYSGGKDSSTLLQLFMKMLIALPEDQRKNKVYVCFCDTLVEPPPLHEFTEKQLESIRTTVELLDLPIEVVTLKPKMSDTFFVNLIGKGYKAPNVNGFRWCTSRLKQNPTNEFIKTKIQENGSIYMVVGTRKDESKKRSNTLTKYTLRGKIKKNTTMANSFIYAPLEDWTTEEIWNYLVNFKSPYGTSNKDLERLYEESSINNDIYQQARHGCWCCTVCDEDKSMMNFIENGYNMQPLKTFRDYIKRKYYDVNSTYERRKHGSSKKTLVKIEDRVKILEKLFETELAMNRNLILNEELEEIQKVWNLDNAPITVYKLKSLVEKGKKFILQQKLNLDIKTIEINNKSSVGSIQELFNDLWIKETAVEVLQTRTNTIIKRYYCIPKTINGKQEWIIDREENINYKLTPSKVILKSLNEGIYDFNGVMTDKSVLNLKEIVSKINLFETFFWKISKEPDGSVFCSFGEYQNSLEYANELYYKPLGSSKGNNIEEALILARTKFLASNKIDSVSKQNTLIINRKKYKVTPEDFKNFCDNKLLIIQILTEIEDLKGANGLRLVFNPKYLNTFERSSFHTICNTFGLFYDLKVRTNSYVIIPKYCLNEIIPLIIGLIKFNITNVIPVKYKYKYSKINTKKIS